VLYIGGEPAAFWPGAIWNGTFFSGTPGYDTRYSEYGIGKYVLMRVIEDLCSEVGVDRLDYGSGDADYKRQFGSESWTEADVVLFAKRLRPLRINLTKTALEAGVRGAKAAVTRAGLAAKLRRRLRARVASKG
jgi:CelD/BcsL family acetyltransferase involved in cellulose biosynthesis